MRRARAMWACGSVLLALAPAPTPVAAQLEAPCRLGCAAVLGATSFVTATGISIAAGRMSGGLSSMSQGLFIWGASFAAVAGSGMALSGNGERQERAVYAAGLGTLAGGLLGGTLEAARTGGDEAHVISGALIGAAAGALVGGAVGALTYDGKRTGEAVPMFTLRLPLGR